MHARVTKLEAVISTLATREDLVRLEVTLAFLMCVKKID
jgi:hypothetical protein